MKLSVSLFGKFSAQLNGRRLRGLDGTRLQELLSYLLLYRGKPHSRESLASLLWGDLETAQSKKYLRQALWQLGSLLNPNGGSRSETILRVEPEWIDIDSEAKLWLDVAEFEEAVSLITGLAGRELDSTTASTVTRAADLYKGDLLQGCYQDWCIYERERLQNSYLAILDKLMDHCEVRNEFEQAIVYGDRILYHDRARERTHRTLMRLKFIAGDRTAALRQYERCATALEHELGVRPAKETQVLNDKIRADRLDLFTSSEDASPRELPSIQPDALGQLKRILKSFVDLQSQAQQNIELLETLLKQRQ
jgi:DNA-binding SARP family transcriptional activator